MPNSKVLAHPVQRLIDGITGTPVLAGNRVRLLHDGQATFGAMLELIDSAESEIAFENFMFRRDRIGSLFVEALKAASERGVAVRILHDPVGTLLSHRWSIGSRFRHTQLEIRDYNPPRLQRSFFRLGRDHRKLVVQDRRRAVIGGICISDAWLPNRITNTAWRDSAVVVEGQVARQLAHHFDRVWRFSVCFTPHSALPALAAGPSDSSSNEAVAMRVIADEPRHRRTLAVLETVFAAADSSIWITNPYVLPPAGVTRALKTAAARGVDVRILLPGHNNHALAALAMESRFADWLAAGVRIWCWSGPMIHAKTVVIDGVWSLVGSSNLDPLSMLKDCELNVAIHGCQFGSAMQETFLADLDHAVELTANLLQPRSRRRRWAASLAGRFAGAL